MNWALYIDGLFVIVILASLTWLLSLYLKDVSIVDSAWSLMFLATGIYYFQGNPTSDLKTNIFFALLILWSLRLAIHLTWRNWDEPEDRRYQKIREKYSPNFGFKSLFIIFIFQAALASIVSLSVVAVMDGKNDSSNIGYIEYIAIVIWTIGFLYESIADWQLAKFKSDEGNANKVMDIGLWRNTRHPNYFGEIVLWFGVAILAYPALESWRLLTLISPVFVTLLLTKVSGVPLLEEQGKERWGDDREYQRYLETTPVLIPSFSKGSAEN